MRYERKYKTEQLALAMVQQVIRLHPAGFRKIFPDRQVNNIYFDTPDYTTFKENVMGIAERKKFRIRWYGKDLIKIETPSFEIKIKENLLGDKMTQPLPAFEISDIDFVTRHLQKKVESHILLQPTLFNSYHRSYWGTPDGKFRITIDSEMTYASIWNIQNSNAQQLEDEGIVVELKYDEAMDNQAERITQHLPFRLTKSSKYVTGVTLQY